MTNEVKNLIIKNIENENKTAYLFYKEIWKFILYARKYNYEKIKIHFKTTISKENCIEDKDGIEFGLDCISYGIVFNTYHDGTNTNNINNILNKNINLSTLFTLLENDDFIIKTMNIENKTDVIIEISSKKIEDNIENIMLKNKVLTKNNRG